MPAINKLCKYLKRGGAMGSAEVCARWPKMYSVCWWLWQPVTLNCSQDFGGKNVCRLRHLNIAHNRLPSEACRQIAIACIDHNKNLQCIHMAGNAEGLDRHLYDQSKSVNDVFCRCSVPCVLVSRVPYVIRAWRADLWGLKKFETSPTSNDASDVGYVKDLLLFGSRGILMRWSSKTFCCLTPAKCPGCGPKAPNCLHLASTVS